ncbi:MAG TPA: hypothetical protein VFQ41_09345 [Candidatus Angelobacter sp.]|nr:hypothetical protein [Candidatus Angelobacter sp.]
MPNFILKFRGEGPKPADAVERIRSAPLFRILDESSPRMLLVDAPEENLQQVLESLPDWKAYPEQTISLEDPRHQIKAASKRAKV